MPGSLPTEESVLDELSQLIELITSQYESALFICREIYRFYVYHDVSPEIQGSIISEMASTLINNEYKLQPVIEELLQSEHFFEAVATSVDDDKYGAIIKSVSTLKGTVGI